MLRSRALGEVAVFHTYIRAQSGNVVDIDRASFLMDRDLLEESIDAMKRERAAEPGADAISDAQWVWEDYCKRHVERYGERFVPDENPNWDR
jgi:hypothetical protein